MFNVAFGLLVCEAVTSKETASHIFAKFIYFTARPALRTTQPPIHGYRSIGDPSPGVKCDRGMMLTTHPIKCQGQE
jgi:hypothetical protein